MQTIAIYISAGGRSSRFGSDKAQALIRGVPMILHIARRVESIASQVIAIADVRGKYDALGIHTIADMTPGQGPLSALQAALHHASADWIALISCDTPGIRAEWIAGLFDRAADDSMAVAFKHSKWEPLLAIYRRSLRGEVDRRMQTGELAMWRLLEWCGATPVVPPADWHAAIQVTTPEDLRRFCAE